MFYPEDSLRKGGRFYLCWLADSWPVCFATITQRQLWSQDVRKICDDLLQVMNNESGRPGKRFSLRLSSQLMRGLVRVYEKKVNMMLSDLCMIGARVMKHSNKKFNINETAEEMETQLFPLLELPAPVQEPVPEPEERVEEMIQQSGNAVRNIESITLKESAIPELQLPANDGFGEENPNQALQLLQDRTLEEMLGAPSALSALELPDPAAAGDRTGDASRLAVHASMERMSDHDITAFRKSTAQDLVPEELDKEIPIPEIPPPDLPAPTEKEYRPTVVEPELEPAAAAPPPAPQDPEIVTLETLEEGEPQAKRRRKNKLIIDKNHTLTKKFFRARIENIKVDLRCEEFSDDIVDLRVPADILLHRPARAGARFHSHVARALTRLFSTNLGVITTGPLAQREMEFALGSRGRRATAQPALEAIPEEQPVEPQVQPVEPQEQPVEPQEQPVEPQQPQMDELQPIDEPTVLNQSNIVPDLNFTAADVEKDIADMPTQKLETASLKRTPQEDLNTSQTKRQRRGVVSGRHTQPLNFEQQELEIVEKENVPDNWQTLPPRQTDETITDIPSAPERLLSSMLQEAGLADIQPAEPAAPPEPTEAPRRSRGSSETMLGSLDRTKVSLGDSDQTTDSKKFIRDQWGTEGTMVKILKMVKAELQPVDIDSLTASGPKVPGYGRIIVARCFTSILKLKQHGFIKVRKDPETLEILDINLGPKFDSYVNFI